MGKTDQSWPSVNSPESGLTIIQQHSHSLESQHPVCGHTVPEYLIIPWIVVEVATSESNAVLRATYKAKEYSLVDSGIVFSLAGEAEHATDDSAVELVPLRITDLLPFTAILDLHVAFCHRDPFTVRWQDGSNAHILNLDIKALWRRNGEMYTWIPNNKHMSVYLPEL